MKNSKAQYNTQFLGIQGVTDPFIDYSTNNSAEALNEGEWVRRGIRNANAIDLLQDQLRHKTADKKTSIGESIKIVRKQPQPDNWHELLLYIIEAQVLNEPGETTVWSSCNEAIERMILTKEELLGFSLAMAREKNIEGAVCSMIKLLKREEVFSSGLTQTICMEFIRFFSQGNPKSEKDSSSDCWIEEIRLHSDIIKLLSITTASIFDTNEKGTTKTSETAIRKLEEIRISHQKKPDEVNLNTWQILQGISCCNIDPDLPILTLIESHSLPRSGHHYLINLLQKATIGKFSYCESYNEPGCCASNPCSVNSYWRHARNKNENHLRLIKSHDFQLTNKIFKCMPGMYRLIQLREPFELIVSWLELAQLEINKKLLKENSIDTSRIFLYHEASLFSHSLYKVDK